MTGVSSNSAGVLLLPKPDGGGYLLLDIVEGKQKDPVETSYLYSSAQDWEEITGPDAKTILESATREYWLSRSVSLLRGAIRGFDSSLEKEILQHVEEILASHASSEAVLDRLLVAPLADECSPVGLAKSGLSCGCTVVASILDELTDLQPLLRRLTDLWLSLPETTFGQFSEPKENIWMVLIAGGKVRQLLRTANAREFMASWNLLVFQYSAPSDRSGIQKIGDEISRRLFPDNGTNVDAPVYLTEEHESVTSDEEDNPASHHEIFERVKKQIVAIAQAISEGRDSRAKKFLDELIREQTACSGGETHAVKSLCNIAQRCADMFRMDFEIICLQKARELNPDDAWTLIQYGDHLKRVGNYAEALDVFSRAEQLAHGDIAKSSIADVFSQQGDYEKAISVYKAIEHWEAKPAVLTAIADNLREMGRTSESETAYLELISLAQQGVTEFVRSVPRAEAGLAEIAKTQGKLQDALQIYRRIIQRVDIDDHDRIFYRLGLCNVLKLMDDFDTAYEVADTIIQEYPFAMQARFIRGSILGLVGREAEGLRDLPESSGGRSWQEWVRHYYRGLLLLKLGRYEDAKRNLIEELPRAIVSKEERDFLRMAAAVCFLREHKIAEADAILSEIPDLLDCHAQYLALVLKLHLAACRRDRATVNSLLARIHQMRVTDARLGKTITAITKGQFSRAITFEIDALLKLAA